jgi:viroplasmin and RNaseH domain-containing protein
MKNYGVDHPLKNNNIKKKIRKLNENNKIWLPIEKVNDYELYRRSVNKFTKKQNLHQLKNYHLRGHSKDLNSHHFRS